VHETDAELIANAGGGDRTSFQLLYQRHWKAVYRFAWLLTRSVPDAEDVTQECFLALIRRPNSFDPGRSQLRTWLLGAARNQHLQRCRSRGRQTELRDADTIGKPAGLDEELIRVERADAVNRAMADLPEVQREALYLFEFEGLSLADVALVLGIEPNAVKARLYRAREQMKRLLGPLRPALSKRNEDIA
jgi:RNA polymerase sigma-70 factor, ECF subfamily